jgi:hypothetical protein
LSVYALLAQAGEDEERAVETVSSDVFYRGVELEEEGHVSGTVFTL